MFYTSACCTPGRIRRSPLPTLFCYFRRRCVKCRLSYLVASEVHLTNDLKNCWRHCFIRQRVVHPVGFEDPPYRRCFKHRLSYLVASEVHITGWLKELLATLFYKSACCTPGRIRRSPLPTLFCYFRRRCFKRRFSYLLASEVHITGDIV